MPSLRRRWLSLVACLVVGAMSLGLSLAGHADDGCAIEIHCAACLSQVAGLATQVSVPSLAPVWSPDVAGPEPVPSVDDTSTPTTITLRGPPAT